MSQRFMCFFDVEIFNFPGPTGALKCPPEPQLIDWPTENVLFATLYSTIKYQKYFTTTGKWFSNSICKGDTCHFTGSSNIAVKIIVAIIPETMKLLLGVGNKRMILNLKTI